MTFTYDEAGRWEQQIDSSGRVLKNDYDPAGRLIQVTDMSTGDVITRRYDAGGRLEEEIDALDNSTLYTYDNKDRLKTVTNGRNKTTTYDYTDTSITITDPLLRKTTVVSSDYSVPIQTQYPDGTKEQAQYLFANNLQEANNYPTLLIDRGGRNRNFGYDSFGRLKTATSLGSSLYTYDYVNDDLSQITSPLGETLNYGYEDARRNLTRITYGDKRSRVQDYGSDNRLATVTLPSGEIISYTYNSAGQEESRTATQGGTITTTYTADGNIDTMVDSTGLTQYQYDSAGRLVGIDYPSGQKIHYDYDVLSRVEKVITQANETAPESVTSYTYDEVGNLKTVTDPNGGITTMDYDNADRLVERVLPNGVETIYTYDDLDQVESIVHQDSTGLVLASVVYERNPGGEPNKITREDGSYVKLNYDEALRLEEEIYYNPTGTLEEQILYTYDIDGKRIMKQTSFDTLTYSYDPGYQLVSATRGTEEETYSFDVDGRVEEITREGSTLTLDHDTYDRLVQAGSVNNFYDGMNRRVKSTIPVERNFLVAPSMGSGLDSIHQIIDSSGTAVAEYIYAGMTPLLRLEDSGAVYYLTDAMGTIISLADDNARKVANFDYDGFGNLRTGTGAGIPAETGGDFRFHGQWLEQSTGLYHLRTRDYDPITGRFLSRDPVKPILERPESRDPYQFAYNNPLIYVDPSGQITSLSEINFARVIQNVLRDIRRNAIGEIREAAINEAQGVATEVLFSFLRKVLPFDFETFTLDGNWFSPLDFEALGQNTLCEVIKRSYRARYKSIWREVGIRLSGKPFSNGSQCDTQPRRGTTRDRESAISYPDFVIKDFEPKDRDRRPPAYLIGDFKWSVDAIKPSANQWSSIMNYAQSVLKGGHQYINVALYVTFLGESEQNQIKRLESRALRDEKIVLKIIPLFPVKVPAP